MKHILFFILMAATFGQTATAQEANPDTIYRQFALDEVVVTGTRTPKFLKETPIQTRVINAKDIARQDATNVQDLLQQELPGVEFSYAMNQQTHLNFSGFGRCGLHTTQHGQRGTHRDSKGCGVGTVWQQRYWWRYQHHHEAQQATMDT